GDAGRQAAATLSDRLNAASIPNRIVGPLHGDDFNDDLRHGVTAADYAVEEPVVPAMAPSTWRSGKGSSLALTSWPSIVPSADRSGGLPRPRATASNSATVAGTGGGAAVGSASRASAAKSTRGF
ncbi:MAG: toprim domain-containing protein, partial [Planctomycetota bacterium]